MNIENNSNWDIKQKEYVNGIEQTISSFEKILEIDKNGLVIGKNRQEIIESLNRNRRLLDKLKNKVFSIAVVGLEKAGKSTLGNALLGNYILPEYTQRCTYTTTQIKAGDVDIGIVEFYSLEEFNNNFNFLLKSLNFDTNISYETLTKESFVEWWNKTHVESNSSIYQLYKGTIHEDVVNMLNGKKEILQLLGKSPLEFKGEDELKCPDFVLYITGIKYNLQGKKVSDHGPQPYAVKKVSISSRNLQYMKNAVLYDVPGFDSPTKLHKIQTEEMLKKADAIILVTNVGDRPDLNGPQLI